MGFFCMYYWLKLKELFEQKKPNESKLTYKPIPPERIDECRKIIQELTDYAKVKNYLTQKNICSHYIYRTESFSASNYSSCTVKSGWEQLFSEKFVFTDRVKAKEDGSLKPDLQMNELLANNVTKGISRAFYFYTTIDYTKTILKRNYSGRIGAAIVTRFKVNFPL